VRVLFLTRSYPTRSAPVVAPFTRDHFRAASLFAEVAVIHAQKTREPHPWQVEKEDETIRVRFRRRPFPNLLRAFPELPFRPDLVHGHFYDAAGPTLLLARRLGVPFVLTEHSTLARPLTRLERCAFREASRVMPVSRMLQRSLEASDLEAHWEVVPNVVDLASFSPAPHPPGLVKRLVAVTRMTEVKGVPDLLEALRLLQDRRRDWTCELIGGGERGEDYRALASELGLDRVVFRGELRRPEVAAALREADLFVLASRVETFSVATVEAMACGLPVVVTACGGPEELVGPDSGVIVPKQDPAALADALDRTLSELDRFRPEEIAKGVAGRFGAEAVGRRLLQIYEETKKAAGATGRGPRLFTTDL
jgi:glycosyltransferase involved in cell wall biosynthesis